MWHACICHGTILVSARMQARKLSNEDNWRDRIQFRKRKDHFIFTVQSTGILPPDVLFVRALDELSAKCTHLLNRL